jgi:hypothetical protein
LRAEDLILKTSKSRKSRTNDNLLQETNKNIPRELTTPEAEIMFTIWKSNYPITNAKIVRAYSKYFGEHKDEDTVRGIIGKIHKRELRFKRNYLESRGRPKRHQIAHDPLHYPKPNVHSQATAIMLLELRNGYLQKKPKKEILREPFEQYMRDKYSQTHVPVDDRLFKDAADVTNRLEIAKTSGYVRFRKFGKAAGLEAAERVDDDLEYLLLIVNDYAQADSSLDLKKLMAAFGRPDSKNHKDSKGARA